MRSLAIQLNRFSAIIFGKGESFTKSFLFFKHHLMSLSQVFLQFLFLVRQFEQITINE